MDKYNNKTYDDELSNKHWILPCNINKYDVVGAFKRLKSIIWKQSNEQKIGNIIYIYVGKPFQALKFICVVTNTNIFEIKHPREDKDFILDGKNYEHYGKFMELTLLKECDVSVEYLNKNGLKGNIQSSRRISYPLLEAINKIIDNYELDYSNEIENEDKKEVEKLTGDELFNKAKLISSRRIKPYQIKTMNYYRNPIIAKAAKERANGRCQLCSMKAPFNDKNNKPYLESHHIVWLAKGGEDSIDNTVALCPNCHRKMHLLNDNSDISFLLNKIKHE